MRKYFIYEFKVEFTVEDSHVGTVISIVASVGSQSKDMNALSDPGLPDPSR